MDYCEHVASIHIVKAHDVAGCEECLKTGSWWVHLRSCLTCGFVGCCDSSPNKHASAHVRTTKHPVVKSMEPGEDWAFCYIDEMMMEPAPRPNE